MFTIGSRFEYDPNGNLTKVIDELGRATDVKYDAFNRVIRETRFSATGAVNQSVGFAYDHQDELLSVTDPRGLETRYTVDSFGAVTSQKSPDTGTTTIGVDRAGNVETIRDARGMVLPFEYDAAGRITRHGNSRFEYGAAGTSATGNRYAPTTPDPCGCAAKNLGFDTAGGVAIGVGSLETIPKNMVPKGASSGTSIISKGLADAFPKKNDEEYLGAHEQ